MALTLSLNTNPLVNRFADPDDLIDTVARDLRIRDLQLTHEFINPSWPAPVIRRPIRIRRCPGKPIGTGASMARWSPMPCVSLTRCCQPTWIGRRSCRSTSSVLR